MWDPGLFWKSCWLAHEVRAGICGRRCRFLAVAEKPERKNAKRITTPPSGIFSEEQSCNASRIVQRLRTPFAER